MSQTAQDAQRPVASATGASQPASGLTASRASATTRPTGWIIASVVLGAATLMLLIWVAVLDSQNSGSQAATNAQLGTLNSRVGALGTAVIEQQAQAMSAADAANQRQATATAALGATNQQLAAARADFEVVKEGLGATNESLAATQSQLTALKQQADEAQQHAQATSGDLAAAATAAQARADVTHACLQDMLGIMGRVFDADDPQAALPTAASQLRQIEPACASQ